MLLILDCDGVLIDSEIISMEIDARFLTELGMPHTREEAARRFVGRPHAEFLRTVEIDLGRRLTQEELEGHEAEYRRRMLTELRAIDGVREAVAGLGVKYCVASSTHLPILRRNLTTAGLVDLFEPHIFSASQVARGKPAPDVFLHAASQRGFDPGDCLVIEDSVPGVTAARRAGMKAVGFLGGGHIQPGHDEVLVEAGAVAVFSRMAELQAIVAAHAPR